MTEVRTVNEQLENRTGKKREKEKKKKQEKLQHFKEQPGYENIFIFTSQFPPICEQSLLSPNSQIMQR